MAYSEAWPLVFNDRFVGFLEAGGAGASEYCIEITMTACKKCRLICFNVQTPRHKGFWSGVCKTLDLMFLHER